jgi:hypothetical protein
MFAALSNRRYSDSSNKPGGFGKRGYEEMSIHYEIVTWNKILNTPWGCENELSAGGRFLPYWGLCQIVGIQIQATNLADSERGEQGDVNTLSDCDVKQNTKRTLRLWRWAFGRRAIFWLTDGWLTNQWRRCTCGTSNGIDQIELVNKKVLIHIQSDTIPKAAAGTKRLNQSRYETQKPTNNNPKLNTNKRRDQQTYFHAAKSINT